LTLAVLHLRWLQRELGS